MTKLDALLADAQEFLTSAHYILASKRFQQVLDLDPDNATALEGLKRAEQGQLEKSRTDERGFATGDAQPADLRLLSWEWKWDQRPVYRVHDLQREARAILAVSRKLQRIIVPRLEFRSTPISEVIEYLRHESIRLDNNADPGTRGVKIFVQYPKVPPSVPADPPEHASPAPEWEAIPGLPTPALRTIPAKPSTDPKVSLTLSKTPLLNALQYAANQASLLFAVSAKGVQITPLAFSIPFLEDVEFLEVFPLMVGLPRSLDAKSDLALSGYQFHQVVQDWLAARGVGFPVGASVTYLPAKHELIVRNVPGNIDQIKRILTSPSGTNPASFINP